MVDLTTTYLGLKLKNPLVASPHRFQKKWRTSSAWRRPGIGVVMYSLFEEQIIHESLELDHYLNRGTESFAEALTYFPDMGQIQPGSRKYIWILCSRLKQAVSIPVIGSLNGVSTGGWIEYARKIEEAGADALGAQPVLFAHRSQPDQQPAGRYTTSSW